MLRAALDDDGGDDETGLRHPAEAAGSAGCRGPTPPPACGRAEVRAGARARFLCLERSDSYVLKEHTSPSANVISQDIGNTLNPRFRLGFSDLRTDVGTDETRARCARCRGGTRCERLCAHTS